MQKNYIFLTGMVRSGTTLISRAVDAHSEIAAPPDPYFGFFREFRNEIYNKYLSDFDDDSALSDHFFDPNLEPKRELRNTTLERDIENQDLKEIKEEIIHFAESNSPLVIPHVEEIQADTYKELFDKLMGVIHEVYGNEKTALVGFKQTWVEKFVELLINTYPDIKVVQIIRDPRAVMASRTKTSHLRHNYPLYFMIKHWRKSVAYSYRYSDVYKDNFLLVKYENLTTKPEKKLQEISRFLGVDYEPEMANPQNYRDGEKTPWTDNSAYSSTQKITSEYNEKWKDVLPQDKLQFIEDLCHIEMEALGYDRQTEFDLHDSVLSDVQFDDDLDTNWIKKQQENGTNLLDRARNELLRNYIYRDLNSNNLIEDFLEMVYVVPGFLELI